MRQESELSLSDVAERLEVDKSYVANVETGRRNLTLGQLARIADALGRPGRHQVERAGACERDTPGLNR